MKKSEVFITRRESFSAAHKLYRPEMGKEENEAVFGKCSNENWHGHNYILHVTVAGTPDPSTGFVTNLSRLSELVKEKIIRKVDHKNLNLDVDFMKGKMASTEILAVAFWNELAGGVEQLGCRLHCIRVQETENNYVEYYGN